MLQAAAGEHGARAQDLSGGSRVDGEAKAIMSAKVWCMSADVHRLDSSLLMRAVIVRRYGAPSSSAVTIHGRRTFESVKPLLLLGGV
ncbi:hypothetical protein IQ60_00065 [Streptomyces europaeiscabiei]|nr:hypothetical protein IQ60_00065 [Streptomyces europaeiscabiei]